MPLPSTLTPIATNTLTSAASTVVFSNLPQGYTDIFIMANIRGVVAQTLDGAALRFNSDSGSNYSKTDLHNSGSNVLSSRASNETYLRIADSTGGTGLNYGATGASSPSGNFGIGQIHILNYSNSTNFKTIISRWSVTNLAVAANVGLWRSTSAITTITFSGYNGNINSGSVFTLYGIKAAS